MIHKGETSYLTRVVTGLFRQRKPIITVSIATVIFASACGGGGSSSQNNQSASSAAPMIALASNSVDPFGQIGITVINPVAGAAYSAMVDVGNGQTYPATVQQISGTQFSLSAPPVAVSTSDSNLSFGAGTIRVALGRADSTGAVTYSAFQSLALNALPSSGAGLGTIILPYLKAIKLLLLKSESDLLIVKGYDSSINIQPASAAANATAQSFDQLISAIRSIQANPSSSINWGSINGSQLVLNSTSVAYLDQLALAQISALEAASGSSPNIAKVISRNLTKHAARQKEPLSRLTRGKKQNGIKVHSKDDVSDPSDSEIQQFVTDFSASARKTLSTIGNGVSTTTAVIGVVALAAAAPEIAAAAATVGAISFMTTTLYGTALSATLEAGTDATLHGQASVSSLAGAGSFFATQYLSEAEDEFTNAPISTALGPVNEAIVSDAVSTFKAFTDLSPTIESDLSSGTLPSDGVPAQDETISITESASTGSSNTYSVDTTSTVGDETLTVVQIDRSGNETSNSVQVTDGEGTITVDTSAIPDNGFVDVEVYNATHQSDITFVDVDNGDPDDSDSQSIVFSDDSSDLNSGGNSGGMTTGSSCGNSTMAQQGGFYTDCTSLPSGADVLVGTYIGTDTTGDSPFSGSVCRLSLDANGTFVIQDGVPNAVLGPFTVPFAPSAGVYLLQSMNSVIYQPSSSISAEIDEMVSGSGATATKQITGIYIDNSNSNNSYEIYCVVPPSS